MRVVILTSGRGTRNTAIDKWREDLKLEADDVLSMISWQPAAEPLELGRHLVLGPSLRAADGTWQKVAATPVAPPAPIADQPAAPASAPATPTVSAAPAAPRRAAISNTGGGSPVRRVVNKGRRVLKKIKGRVPTRVKALPGKVLRKIKAKMGLNLQFATAAARSSRAVELFRDADLVVPLDARSQQAAWVLAKRVDGPRVVVGFPAANRELQRLRSA